MSFLAWSVLLFFSAALGVIITMACMWWHKKYRIVRVAITPEMLNMGKQGKCKEDIKSSQGFYKVKKELTSAG